MATSPEQAVLKMPEPIILKEENNFDSVWDFEVNNTLPPPSEAITENHIELETYAFPSQESEDLSVVGLDILPCPCITGCGHTM